MDLPEETRKLIERNLEAVRKDKHYNLEASERFKIYQSFGPSRLDLPEYDKHGSAFDDTEFTIFNETQFLNFNQADFTLAYLAIITVRKVIPIWKGRTDVWAIYPFDDSYIDILDYALELAEDLLNGKISFDEAGGILLNELWFMSHNFVTLDMACAYDSAMFAREAILFGGYDLNYVSNDMDAQVLASSGDFAFQAARVYCVVDANEPGQHNYHPDVAYPIIFDEIKRLEFWEWWLNEAITQAWDLAHSASISFS